MIPQSTDSSVLSGVARRRAVLEDFPRPPVRGAADCRSCAARRAGLCQGEGAEDVAPLASGRRLVARQDLFMPGDPADRVHILVEGWVFLYALLEDGRRQILHFALPGALLGFAAEGAVTMQYGAQALTDATLCAIPRGSLEALVLRKPELGMRLAGLLARDRQSAFDRLASLGRQTARERVARLLLELHLRSRGQWRGKGADAAHLPLTQELIGDATGLTFVHVSRVLSDLRREGIVEFQYRKLRILDPDRLAGLSGAFSYSIAG